MNTESIMNNNSPIISNMSGGRLRSRTFSYRPATLYSNNNNTEMNQATNTYNKQTLNISEINSPLSSTSSVRRRSKSTIGSNPNLEYKQTQLTLSSNFLLDKYEEDLSDKLNKIETSDLSIKNLFNHKRRLSAGSNQRPSIVTSM